MSPLASHALLAGIGLSSWFIVRAANWAIAKLDQARRAESALVREAEKLAADEALRLKRAAQDRHFLQLAYRRHGHTYLSFDDDRETFRRSLEQIDGEPRA